MRLQRCRRSRKRSRGSGNGRDDYFVEAGKFIIEKDKASIGMLQRVFKIGFNRAARIMDQLAEAGVVGEEEGTKPRKVLMSMEEFEQYHGIDMYKSINGGDRMMKTDIEIAQEAVMKPITEVAAATGIDAG